MKNLHFFLDTDEKGRLSNFSMIPNLLIEADFLSPVEKQFLIFVLSPRKEDEKNKDKNKFRTKEEIMKACGIHSRTFSTVKKDLVKRGCVAFAPDCKEFDWDSMIGLVLFDKTRKGKERFFPHPLVGNRIRKGYYTQIPKYLIFLHSLRSIDRLVLYTMLSRRNFGWIKADDICRFLQCSYSAFKAASSRLVSMGLLTIYSTYDKEREKTDLVFYVYLTKVAIDSVNSYSHDLKSGVPK